MSSSGGGNNEQEKKPPPREEFNARSVGYLLIALGSLINLSSVSNVKEGSDFEGLQSVAIAFGATTFGLSSLILIVDRTVNAFDYTKAAGGKLEGATLLFFTLFWTAGLGYLTQVRGIAYVALNVYASSWMTWALCILTLNEWSASKDILTIAEITGISETLKSWYVLALSSMVVTGSSLDFWFKTTNSHSDDAVFGFCFGAASMLLSWGWILTHMNFFECCQEGGWMELASAWVSILLWIVNCAVLTRDEGIGATIVGTHYRWRDEAWRTEFPFDDGNAKECRLVWESIEDNLDSVSKEESIPLDCPLDTGIPGSNLYVAAWISLAASINVALRWNAQRALELAQPTRRVTAASSSNTKANQSPQRNSKQRQVTAEDDDDLDDFIDADAY